MKNSKYVKYLQGLLFLNLWFVIVAIVYSNLWMILLAVVVLLFAIYVAHRAYPGWKRVKKVKLKWRKKWESGSSIHTTFTDYNIDQNLYFILRESQYRCGFFDLQVTYSWWVYAFDLSREDLS